MVLGASVYQQALHKLVAGAYLKPSTVLSHISPRDKQIKYEAEERSKISGIPTAKELREAKELAGARLKREEEAETVGMVRRTYHASLFMHKHLLLRREKPKINLVIALQKYCIHFDISFPNSRYACRKNHRKRNKLM